MQVDLCPVVAILAYVTVRSAVSGPLFVFKDGSFLTRDRLVSAIRRALCTAGVDTKGYSAPSFQIGAAKTAALVGIKHSTIKMLGRWESSAHQRYLRTPRESLAAIPTRHIVHSSVIICIYWGRVVQLRWWYPCLGGNNRNHKNVIMAFRKGPHPVQMHTPIPSQMKLYAGPLSVCRLSSVSAIYPILINPRRACAARVTVLGLSVCLSTLILGLQATRRPMSYTNGFRSTRA